MITKFRSTTLDYSSVAELAAPLHGTDKDELIGEDVRQHKRTVRLAWTAMGSVISLAIAAVAFGLIALSERDRAQQNADIALSRQLAAQARLTFEDQLDLGLLLAAAAASHGEGTVEAESALLAGIRMQPALVTLMRGYNKAAISADGKFLAATSGARIQLWDLSRERRMAILGGGESQILSAAFLNGRALATASDQGRVTIWDVERARMVDEFPAHAGPITRLTVSPDGSLFATAGSDGYVTVWDWRLGNMIMREEVSAAEIAFGPNQTLVAGGVEGDMISCALSTTPPSCDHRTGLGAVKELAYGPDGKLVIATSTLVAACGGTDCQLISDGTETGSLAFSPNGRYVAVDDILWDVSRGVKAADLGGNDQPVTAVAFHSSAPLLAVAAGSFSPTEGFSGSLSLCDIHVDGALECQALEESDAAVDHIEFSPNSDLLAAGLGTITDIHGVRSRIELWDSAARTLLAAATPHLGPAPEVHFTPGGEFLVSVGSEDVLIWDFDEPYRPGTVIGTVEDSITELALHPTAPLLAFASATYRPTGRSNTVALLTLETGSVQELEGDLGGPLAFSHDGATLATVASTDGHIVLIDPLSREAIRHLAHLRAPFAWSPTSNILAAMQSDGTSPILWNVSGNRLEAELPLLRPNESLSVGALAFSPSGSLLSIGTYEAVHIWDVREGRSLTPALPISMEPVTLAFSPDEEMLAAGSEIQGDVGIYGEMVVWDIDTGLRLIDQGTPHSSIAFSPDSRLLAAASAEGTLALWDLESEKSLGNLCQSPSCGPTEATLFHGGGTVITGTSGDIVAWPIDRATWVETACTIANRNLTRREWDRFVGSSEPYSSPCELPGIARSGSPL